MKKILITGVAGFIGSTLAKKLIEDNQIVGLDDFNDYYPHQIKEKNISHFAQHENFTLYRGDIRDEKLLSKIFSEHRIDKIIHLAARAGVRPSLENPQLYMSVNFLGTQKVLDFAIKQKIKQFIFASSSSVYGNNSKIPFSEKDSIEKPISPYAISKIAGEKLCLCYNFTYKLPVTILRFFSVYGPCGRPDMAPYIFTKKILNDEKIEIYGDGSQARDFTYIDDIVAGIIKTLDIDLKHNAKEIINLGNSYPISVNELICSIEKITNKKVRISYEKVRLGDVEKTYADITQASTLLNWKPKTKLEEGMRLFIKWFKQNNIK